jgi:predicted TPR repeat methyltransferase
LAIQLYERSTRLAPQTAWYWVQLGYAQQAAGSIDKAIAAYEQVLKLEPSNQEALKQLEILR